MKLIIGLLLILSFAKVSLAEEMPSLTVTQLAAGIYQHKSYKHVDSYGLVSANGLVVVIENEAYIVDTPWNEKGTLMLVQWIEGKGFTVNSSISTHFHQDASGGIAALNKLGITTYVTSYTNQLLEEHGLDKGSKQIFAKTYSLANGNIEIFYPGAGHTHDNTVVWIANEKFIFAGCLVKGKENKSLGFIEDANLDTWPQSIEKITKKYPNMKVVVPGHGQTGDSRLFEHTKYLLSLYQLKKS